jgi:hypothetical protein
MMEYKTGVKICQIIWKYVINVVEFKISENKTIKFFRTVNSSCVV